MHSDFWAYVPYDQCPPNVQANSRACDEMDLFWKVSRANRKIAENYVESLFAVLLTAKPVLLPLPVIEDREAAWLLEKDVRTAHNLFEAMKTHPSLVDFFLSEWVRTEKREADYLAYNKMALQKRIFKRAEQAEIDRVAGLIAEGEAKLAHLRPRIEWAKAYTKKLSSRLT